MKKHFNLHSPFKPSGDQPEAIKKLAAARPGKSVLLGVTGSGKTFALANVIEKSNKQVLVLSPNKTLAAQLYEEFSLFFPENKVCYFVSYYDYYQPESYLPSQDIYIPKETKINTEIERLRVETTASIINRPDTIVIASVSAIYSLGNPSDYRNLAFSIKVGDQLSRKELITRLIAIQYKRNDVERMPGTFSVLGDVLQVYLPYLASNLRIELFGDSIERLELVDRHNQSVCSTIDDMLIFPAKHFVTTDDKLRSAILQIKGDLQTELEKIERDVQRERLRTRVMHDIEMLEETSYCSGIENYSRYFDGRVAGSPPFCLFDFFERDFLLIIDESHVTVPQLTGMFKGDLSRKKNLVDYGFRLPSAYDNRPLKFEEIERFFDDVIFVSATPGEYEVTQSSSIVEQVVRPTGIVDPEVEVVKRIGQMDHLIKQIQSVAQDGYRTLVTVLTKKMAEDLARYLQEKKIKVCYMHSEVKTPQRTEILQKLRAGIFDCLVGINLLREGLDLPEVALVAILDADIEGFLRDKRSLIQTIGRAARNVKGRVILYADKITGSMKDAIDETNRRRSRQQQYNKKHGIKPKTVERDVIKSITKLQAEIANASAGKKRAAAVKKLAAQKDRAAVIQALKAEMQAAAENLDFEKAIELRDQLLELEKHD